MGIEEECKKGNTNSWRMQKYKPRTNASKCLKHKTNEEEDIFIRQNCKSARHTVSVQDAGTQKISNPLPKKAKKNAKQRMFQKLEKSQQKKRSKKANRFFLGSLPRCSSCDMIFDTVETMTSWNFPTKDGWALCGRWRILRSGGG